MRVFSVNEKRTKNGGVIMNGLCFIEFTRNGASVPEVASNTAKALKSIIAGNQIDELDNNIFVIQRDCAKWTLYPPGSCEEQSLEQWRLAVEALPNEKNHTALEDRQKSLERDLPYIAIILVIYH